MIFKALLVTTLRANGLYIISAAPSSYAMASDSVVASPVIIITGICSDSPVSFMWLNTSIPDFSGMIRSKNIRQSSSLYSSSFSIASTPFPASIMSKSSSKIIFNSSLFMGASSTISIFLISHPMFSLFRQFIFHLFYFT